MPPFPEVITWPAVRVAAGSVFASYPVPENVDVKQFIAKGVGWNYRLNKANERGIFACA